MDNHCPEGCRRARITETVLSGAEKSTEDTQ